uniref:Chromosome segregation in meiosis protein 3 domain-containing protein n=1 Tax=Hyaloperonospora arabidopsidis (strain Emoy2) TaxID=559515 RepID=M4BUG3_HYAAE
MADRKWERDDDLTRQDDAEDAIAPVDGAIEAEEGKEDVASSTPSKKRRRNLLRESHLLSAEGFKKVYRTFPYQVSSTVSGREAPALASLIKMYKQWAYDLYPGLNFEDFVDRTETLAKGHQVQGLMAEMREKERRKRVERRCGKDEEDLERQDDEVEGDNE